MTLSEAIRAGIPLVPHTSAPGRTFGPDGAGCVMVTAWVGKGGARRDYPGIFSRRLYEFELLQGKTPCPVVEERLVDGVRPRCSFAGGQSIFTAMHLFDAHAWTREAIAEWHAGLERTVAARRAADAQRRSGHV